MTKEEQRSNIRNAIYASKHDRKTYYQIRRAFGLTFDACPISTALSICNIFNKNVIGYVASAEDRNIELLVTGLCYTVEDFNSQTRDLSTVRFEVLLQRLYRQASDTGKNEIKKFLDKRLDTNGYFSKTFAYIAKKALKYKQPNERIDYAQLLDDLSNWNKRTTRVFWAKRIAYYEE